MKSRQLHSNTPHSLLECDRRVPSTKEQQARRAEPTQLQQQRATELGTPRVRWILCVISAEVFSPCTMATRKRKLLKVIILGDSG
jgi:hypothetical protein